MTTKIERAIGIYKNNQRKMTNIEIVNKIIKDLNMTTAGARTYAYNARKILESQKRVRPARKAASVSRTAASDKKAASSSSSSARRSKTPALDTIVKAKKRSPAKKVVKSTEPVVEHVSTTE